MRNIAPALSITLALALAGCAPTDADGDGVPAIVDCDDTRTDIFPGASEICDGVDNDCNGVTDDDYARGGSIFFLDRDGDGFGVWDGAKVQCTAPAGYVTNPDDCADDDATVFPGAPEFCDKIDQNCNSILDEDAVDAVAYYSDFDQDGFGGTEQAEFRCEQPEGFITRGGDCNDFDANFNPAAPERCDFFDNNCNGIVDEGASLDASTWYTDVDNDGYGSIEDTIQACYAPEYYVGEDEAGDCDDSDATINPGARERCWDKVDNNCNGSADQCDIANWETLGDAFFDFSGSGPSNYVGYEMDFVGDFNGDGFDDMIFGGYRAQTAACSARGSIYCGGAYLMFGAEELSGSFVNTDTVDLGTGVTYDYTGRSVAGVGDLDNDGYDDLVIGSYSQDYGGSSAGAAYIVYGNTTMAAGDWYDLDASAAMIFGNSSSDYFGWSSGGPGDMDGDGYDDLIVGAYLDDVGGSSTGTVVAVYGGKNRLSFHSMNEYGGWRGERASDNLGGGQGSAIGGDDFNGDGFADVLLGAWYWDAPGLFSNGRVYYIEGSAVRPTGITNVAEAATATFDARSNGYAYLGSSVGSVGDVNGDGYADAVMGAYGWSSYSGRCAVFFGSAEGFSGSNDIGSSDVGMNGPQTYDYMCRYGATGSDLSGDGVNELVFTNYYADRTVGGSITYSTGATYVFAGGADLAGDLKERDAQSIIYGPSSYQYTSSGTARRTGDVNGDGFGDILIGKYNSGQVYGFFGVGL